MPKAIDLNASLSNRLAYCAVLSSVLAPSGAVGSAAPALPAQPWPFYYRAENAATTIAVRRSGPTGDPVVDNYRPRTELGRRLIALRRAYIESGGQLLDGPALDREMRLRRGGLADD